MIDLTPLVQAVIAVAAALITAYVVPFIKNKTAGTKWEQLLSLAKTGVEAAEQVYQGTGLGEKKKAYVKAFLEKYGFSVDLDAIIEAAVKEMKLDEAAVEGAELTLPTLTTDAAKANTPNDMEE